MTKAEELDELLTDRSFAGTWSAQNEDHRRFFQHFWRDSNPVRRISVAHELPQSEELFTKPGTLTFREWRISFVYIGEAARLPNDLY